MIPLKEFKEYIEKNAGTVSSIGKLVYNHPRTTLGLIGGMALTGVGLSLADKLHPAHQMFREETKRISMNDQTRLLREMVELQKKNIKIKKPEQKRIVPPLT